MVKATYHNECDHRQRVVDGIPQQAPGGKSHHLKEKGNKQETGCQATQSRQSDACQRLSCMETQREGRGCLSTFIFSRVICIPWLAISQRQRETHVCLLPGWPWSICLSAGIYRKALDVLDWIFSKQIQQVDGQEMTSYKKKNGRAQGTCTTVT